MGVTTCAYFVLVHFDKYPCLRERGRSKGRERKGERDVRKREYVRERRTDTHVTLGHARPATLDHPCKTQISH